MAVVDELHPAVADGADYPLYIGRGYTVVRIREST
jgi:hypothetical protein